MRDFDTKLGFILVFTGFPQLSFTSLALVLKRTHWCWHYLFVSFYSLYSGTIHMISEVFLPLFLFGTSLVTSHDSSQNNYQVNSRWKYLKCLVYHCIHISLWLWSPVSENVGIYQNLFILLSCYQTQLPVRAENQLPKISKVQLFKPYILHPSLPHQNETNTMFHGKLWSILLTLRIWRHHLTHMLARQNRTRVVMTVDVNSHLALSGCGRTTEGAKSAVGP